MALLSPWLAYHVIYPVRMIASLILGHSGVIVQAVPLNRQEVDLFMVSINHLCKGWDTLIHVEKSVKHTYTVYLPLGDNLYHAQMSDPTYTKEQIV